MRHRSQWKRPACLLVTVLGIALVIGLTSPALARDKDARSVQAQTECMSGNTDAGVAKLAQLYAETHNANFVYNQARCYEQASRPDEAIGRFREYLRLAKNISGAERADVERHIEECRELKAEQERENEKLTAEADDPPPVRRPIAPVPEVEVPASEVTPGALALTTQRRHTVSEPIYETWWFWTGLGAVVVAGTVTTVLLLSRSSSRCSADSNTCLVVP